MSAIVQEAAGAFLARFEGLSGRLPGDGAARRDAASVLRRAGLPGVRDEAWKYTSLRPLAEASFHEALTEVGAAEGLLAGAPMIDAPRLVYSQGRYRADLSDPPPSVEIATFATRPEFGPLARPARDTLVALNTMLAEDGAVITLAPGQDGGTLSLVSLGADAHGRPVAFHPRHRVHLGAGARLVLVDIAVGQGTYLHNPVTEVTLEEGATLTHVRLQGEAESAFHLSTTYVEIAAGAVYDGFTLMHGARLARAEIHARMHGPGAAAHLNGAQLLRGAQHGDITTVVTHDAPSCASRQTIKNVLAGRSRGVFQGRIEVARVAQKTDGYQMNQALLLSPDAEIDTKPELRIYADDVKCSHGATVGELDAGQLFYLRSRGVPEAAARAILVRAFLSEALDPIADEAARGLLERAVDSWWAREAA